jgi:pimeloyl-ACP methyl ester carboxylesterase
MTTAITSQTGPIRGLGGLQQIDQASAKHVLKQLAVQINGRSGILKLMHTQKSDTDMVFERKSWWQAFARRSGKAENTAQALRTLYDRANLSPLAKEQLNQYLALNNNRVGGTELANLFNKHLRSGVSDALIRRVLPAETAVMSAPARYALFGSKAERQQPASSSSVNGLMRSNPDFNPDYQIGDGPDDPKRLVGISRSANGINQQFDLNAPIVVFFGGSHGSCDQYAYPAAEVAGKDSPVPLNFLAVDYRGFGQSSDTPPTPKSITEDGLKVYEHVKSLGFRPDQIILRGYSLGAAVAGRVHAAAELKGEKLGAVVYDRPMASAANTAGVMVPGLGKLGALVSVGHFGANRYLDKIPRKEGHIQSPVMVFADTEQEHGPAAKGMAQKQMVNSMDTGGKHDDHDKANNVFRIFISDLYAPQ